MPRPVDSPYDENKPWLDQARSETVASAVAILSLPATLTDSEIRHIGALGIDIVPAQGPNTVIDPISALFVFKPVETGYGNVGSQPNDLMITVGGLLCALAANSQGFLNSSINRVFKAVPPVGDSNAGFHVALEDVVNQPVQLWNWSGSEYTGGNTGSVLEVTVVYNVLSVL